MKKIIGFSICMLLITLVLPTSIADVEPLTTSIDDVESDISAGINVTITEKPVLEITEIKGGFGVKATIKNIGNVSATNIYWGMYLEGGHAVLGKKNGFVKQLRPNRSTTIRMFRIFGFGETTLEIIADCAEGVSVNGSASGTLLLFFLLDIR